MEYLTNQLKILFLFHPSFHAGICFLSTLLFYFDIYNIYIVFKQKKSFFSIVFVAK